MVRSRASAHCSREQGASCASVSDRPHGALRAVVQAIRSSARYTPSAWPVIQLATLMLPSPQVQSQERKSPQAMLMVNTACGLKSQLDAAAVSLLLHRIDLGQDGAVGRVVTALCEDNGVRTIATCRARSGQRQGPAILQVGGGPGSGDANREVLRIGHLDVQLGEVIRVGALANLVALLRRADSREVVERFS